MEFWLGFAAGALAMAAAGLLWIFHETDPDEYE